MRIRCERCATIYELDERRLPAHGALVKCTRCDHVFRAAPPAPGSPAPPRHGPDAEAPPVAAEEHTELFGFTAPGAVERTASLTAVPPPEPAPPRRRETTPATSAAIPDRGRPAWVLWVVLAALVAALAIAAGWYVVQSRAATPTTRLPAGDAFLPT